MSLRDLKPIVTLTIVLIESSAIAGMLFLAFRAPRLPQKIFFFVASVATIVVSVGFIVYPHRSPIITAKLPPVKPQARIGLCMFRPSAGTHDYNLTEIVYGDIREVLAHTRFLSFEYFAQSVPELNTVETAKRILDENNLDILLYGNYTVTEREARVESGFVYYKYHLSSDGKLIRKLERVSVPVVFSRRGLEQFRAQHAIGWAANRLVLTVIASNLCLQKNYNRAVELLDVVLSRDRGPKVSDELSLELRAIAKSHLKRFREASEDYYLAAQACRLSHNPKFTSLEIALAHSYLDAGYKLQAYQQYDQILHRDRTGHYAGSDVVMERLIQDPKETLIGRDSRNVLFAKSPGEPPVFFVPAQDNKAVVVFRFRDSSNPFLVNLTYRKLVGNSWFNKLPEIANVVFGKSHGESAYVLLDATVTSDGSVDLKQGLPLQSKP